MPRLRRCGRRLADGLCCARATLAIEGSGAPGWPAQPSPRLRRGRPGRRPERPGRSRSPFPAESIRSGPSYYPVQSGLRVAGRETRTGATGTAAGRGASPRTSSAHTQHWNVTVPLRAAGRPSLRQGYGEAGRDADQSDRDGRAPHLQPNRFGSGPSSYPVQSGLCVVASKPLPVLNGSYWPVAAASAVRARRAATFSELMGLKVAAAVMA